MSSFAVIGVVQIFDSKSTKSLKITDLAPSLMSKKRDKARKTARTRKTVMTRNTAKARMPTARNGDPLQDTTKNTRQEEGVKAA